MQNPGVKALREASNLRQIDMANILGISRVTYHRKEHGKIDFTITEAKKIKQHFNLDAVESIFFD